MVHLADDAPIRRPVLTKAEMYPRLYAGEFGNTLPRWFDFAKWRADPNGYPTMPLWGIQSATKAGDPRARLNTPRDEVMDYLMHTGLWQDGYCISPMIHQFATPMFEGDVYDHPELGLLVSGNVAPIVPGSWRTHMKHPRLWKHAAALAMLRQVMNPNSFDDLMELRDSYPNHVYEFTALDRCYGTCPHRNCVFWEVRRY